MLRVLLGSLLLVHALAHALSGSWSAATGSMWRVTALWSVAFLAYTCSGLGILRVPVARTWWKLSLLVGTAASAAMILWYHPPWGMPGIVIDIVLLLVAAALQPTIDADIDMARAQSRVVRHPRWIRVGWTLGALAVGYGAIVLLARPVLLQWGTTPEERSAVLPGDEVHPVVATYRIDHAITIHAPPSVIWPWLVQLGQDRGGFYSYAWLERAVGDDIRNADRVHPEWQQRHVGDTILAVQRDYMGGRFGTVGWRVNALQDDRVIGLENWGTFVLQPVDSITTRLIVRTRGAGQPTATSFLLAPAGVFIYEPAHFIMERGMLRGIRDRAEAAQKKNYITPMERASTS